MKYKKVENKEEDDSEVLDIELIEHGEMSKESDIQDNSELLEKSLKKDGDNEIEYTTENVEYSDENGSSDSESSYEEEENTQTSAIFDSIMSDNRVIAALGGAILLFIGSYLSFWGVIADTVKISQGNLFTGYMFGGIFGKLCVILAAVSAVLVCIRVYKAAWYFNIVSFISYIVQVLLIVFTGKNVLGADVKVTMYPAFGSIICLIGLIIMTVFIRKLSNINKKIKK
jgi:hypothetical protein